TFSFPASGHDLGPRNGRCPTDPYLVNGPVVNQDLVAALAGNGTFVQATGATWDNPDRHAPYTDQFTIGYERQIATDMSVSADYIYNRQRDMLMQLNLNPNQRSNPNVNASTLTRIGSPTLTEAFNELRLTHPDIK